MTAHPSVPVRAFGVFVFKNYEEFQVVWDYFANHLDLRIQVHDSKYVSRGEELAVGLTFHYKASTYEGRPFVLNCERKDLRRLLSGLLNREVNLDNLTFASYTVGRLAP